MISLLVLSVVAASVGIYFTERQMKRETLVDLDAAREKARSGKVWGWKGPRA